MRIYRRVQIIVITASLVSTVLFVAFFWHVHRSSLWSVEPLAMVTRHSTATPSLRLRNDEYCTATNFQGKSKPLPLDFVTTNISQKHGGNSTSESVSFRNKNEVRVVPSRHTSNWSHHGMELPPAYVVTPTYARPTQKADLLRLCYTLMHVPRVHWIVIEDSHEITATVTEILANCHGPSVTHLAAKDSVRYRVTSHRGVTQRNAALDWIHRCVRPSSSQHSAGGVLFADDDNTYDLLVFEAVRWTQKVSIWPVGVIANALWEGPLCSNGKVAGWEGSFAQNRQFPVDMASFSVGVNFLLSKPDVRFQHKWQRGYLETRWLEALSVSMDQLTPEPDGNCSQVLVWHTRTLPKGTLKLPKTKPKVKKTQKH